MIHARIREIRKKKGLTLQEVAERAGTTAQTIGRLETGMRTLSLAWVSRIAGALGAEPQELLGLPESGDVEIMAAFTSGDALRKGAFGTLSLRLAVREPLALKFNAPVGEFRKGDVLVFERKGAEDLAKAQGRLSLAGDAAGNLYLARVVGAPGKGEALLIPEADPAKPVSGKTIKFAAPAVFLVREFAK